MTQVRRNFRYPIRIPRFTLAVAIVVLAGPGAFPIDLADTYPATRDFEEGVGA